MSKCIIFCGYKGSGKDTFSDYIVKTYGFVKLAFASTLKDYCSEKYDVPREHFDNINYKDVVIKNNPKVYNKTPRDLCIEIGTYYRNQNINWWVNAVLDKIDNNNWNCNSNPNFVISDCRYPNEISKMKNKFGKNCLVIWIHRFEKSSSDDPSENSLNKSDCDIVLDNTKLLRFHNLDEILKNFINKIDLI